MTSRIILALFLVFLSTCHQSVEGSCLDRNRYCEYWARIGECTKNPRYMIPFCCKSCKGAEKIADVCQDKTLNINCNSGDEIYIRSSFYGRRSKTICGNHDVPVGGCSASSALQVVAERCNGKQTCSIRASNDVFGDPCFQIDKYLTVLWTCVPKTVQQSVCEHTTMEINCGDCKVIKIQSNFYGRNTTSICGGYTVPSSGCSASNAYYKAAAACDGRSQCTIQASNSVFGDPCLGTYKYMTTSWTCETSL